MTEDKYYKAAETLASLQKEMVGKAEAAPKTARGVKARSGLRWAFEYAHPRNPFEADPFSTASGVQIRKARPGNAR